MMFVLPPPSLPSPGPLARSTPLPALHTVYSTVCTVYGRHRAQLET